MDENLAKLTDDAWRILKRSQQEAKRLNHPHLGPEHLLLGMVRQPWGLAGEVLNNLGTDPGTIGSAIDFILRAGEIVPARIGVTPSTGTVVKLAIAEAARLADGKVGPEHLLLGLTRDGENMAAGVLESRGLTFERLDTEVRRMADNKVPQGP